MVTVERGRIRDRQPQILILPIPPSARDGFSENIARWREDAGRKMIWRIIRAFLWVLWDCPSAKPAGVSPPGRYEVEHFRQIGPGFRRGRRHVGLPDA